MYLTKNSLVDWPNTYSGRSPSSAIKNQLFSQRFLWFMSSTLHYSYFEHVPTKLIALCLLTLGTAVQHMANSICIVLTMLLQWAYLCDLNCVFIFSLQWVLDKQDLMKERQKDLKFLTEEEYWKLQIFFANGASMTSFNNLQCSVIQHTANNTFINV